VGGGMIGGTRVMSSTVSTGAVGVDAVVLL